jgi:hypothetical protein
MVDIPSRNLEDVNQTARIRIRITDEVLGIDKVDGGNGLCAGSRENQVRLP